MLSNNDSFQENFGVQDERGQGDLSEEETNIMSAVPRFELATPCTPFKCASKLRVVT